MQSRISVGKDVSPIRIATLALAALLVATPGYAPPDGVGLRVDKGPLAGQITLNWTGGQPMFDVYRANGPINVTDPGNYVTSTGVRTFTTGVGPTQLSCFVISSPCVVGPPEVCDGADNDCNGTVDDPGSESSCSVPNATPACVSGACAVGSCNAGYWDCNALASDGCERDTASLQSDLLNCGSCNNACVNRPNSSPTCSSGNCGFFCDPGYSDCNLAPVDGCESFYDTDAQNCGSCGNVCPGGANAVVTCSSSSCGFSCLAGFHNCDSNPANGCERTTASLQTDSLNCGGCGVTCTLPNGLAVCSAGSCQAAVASCDPNYYDINGNPADGCEYGCTFTSSTDLPDDTFTDANCDGIDGDVTKAVFVSTSGNDGNPGTQAQPMLTINGAIGAAINIPGKTEVYVSQGTYLERVSLANGISLYGGYSASSGWARSASNVSIIQSNSVIAGRVNAVECNAVTLPTKLDRLRITTGGTSSSGVSNYAVHANGCSGLSITTCIITAGAAGPGSGAGPVVPGGSGSNGGPGFPGSCDGARGNGGNPGSSACARTGGAGGAGGPEGANPGVTGASGVGGTPGGVGGGGGDPGNPGGVGQNGLAGAPGTNGPGGSGGTGVSGFWVGNGGGAGSTGSHGNGGGGGGGGGGQGCFLCDDGGGNGGGGGGGGGCGGNGASGGNPGGGSFSVFLVNSTGSSITGSTLVTSGGGSGGSGGSGGVAGTGGIPGPGAVVCVGEVGRGGNGGAGGAGGMGGHGGGGAGGPSFSVYRVGTSVTLTGNSFVPGIGGSGGGPPGNPGVAGASGSVF